MVVGELLEMGTSLSVTIMVGELVVVIASLILGILAPGRIVTIDTNTDHLVMDMPIDGAKSIIVGCLFQY